MAGFLSQPLSSSMTSSMMGPSTQSLSMSPIGMMETSEVLSLQEPKGVQAVTEENLKYSAFVSYIMERFNKDKVARYFDEQRMLQAYTNFRGLSGPDTQFTATEKSRVFLRMTAMKVNAAYAQITEVLLSDRFPIGVQPTTVPVGIEKDVSFDPKSPENSQPPTQGGAAPAPQTSATIARPSILQALGPVEDKVKDVKDKLVSGIISTPSAAVFSPAADAAKLMNDTIQDQLEESDATKHLRAFCFEFCLLGTGIFKGPVLKSKEYPKWDNTGQYTPLMKDVPEMTQVSVWDIYPDGEARKPHEMERLTQRYRFSKSQVRQLKKRPFFRPESIDLAISYGPNYEDEYWENTLRDSKNDQGTERYEVLEYWGLVDKEVAEQAGLEIPEQYKDYDEVQVNAWICNNQLLRLVFNPFTPARIPYYIAPYELNPYSIFGIGVAENMADTQLMMNGFIRMLIDNAVKSSNIVFEVNENNLVPGQDFDIYPGKVFKTNGQVGQSIFATKFPNVTQECILAFDKFRQLADEATGLPSYSHGISGVMSTGRTASGMSMLMGAADKSIKSVVRNIDDYLLVPLGKALYAFNMQFNFQEKFIGDLDIVALGTDSLMRNEVRSQKILQFLQVTANPMDAPFTNRSYLLGELAASMELEKDKAVYDQRQAILNAEAMKNLMIAQGIPPESMQSGAGAGGNTAAVPQPTDATGNGGGNIAPGQGQSPGAPGFTGSGGGNNGPERPPTG